MTLTQPQQRKVEQNLGLVGKTRPPQCLYWGGRVLRFGGSYETLQE